MSSLPIHVSTCAVVVLALAACGGREPERINVLLVTLDTTRADRLHCYGNERIETPNLDRLAREGALFEAAFTAVPSTLPSHCSIFTGVYPARHGVHDNGIYALPEESTTLAERFRRAGYRTAAFVSAFVLDQQFGLAQGFESYDDEMQEPLLEGDPEQIRRVEGLTDDSRRWLIQQASPYQRRADAVTPRALDWLADQGGEPFFLWVHYFDPHMDYVPPAPWDGRYDPSYAGELDGRAKTLHFASERHGWTPTAPLPEAERQHMIALYDGEVSFMDEWIGRLFEALRARGDWERTLVIVVGDHGEGFGEHGLYWEHNGQIFDEVARVPLIVKLPGEHPVGVRVPQLVRTIDVAPTALDATGLELALGADGLSLAPLARAEPDAPRPSEALLEALRERQASPTEFSWLGLRTDRHKLFLLCGADGKVTQRALFDVAADPRELAPIEPEHSEEVEEWTARILDGYERMKSAAGETSFRGMDRLTSRALGALGYTDDEE